jgi:hypothetical protein
VYDGISLPAAAFFNAMVVPNRPQPKSPIAAAIGEGGAAGERAGRRHALCENCLDVPKRTFFAHRSSSAILPKRVKRQNFFSV